MIIEVQEDEKNNIWNSCCIHVNKSMFILLIFSIIGKAFIGVRHIMTGWTVLITPAVLTNSIADTDIY